MGADVPADRDAVTFPPGLVDGHGLRLRLGAAVREARPDGTDRVGEVVGWRGELGVDVFTDDGDLVTVQPEHLMCDDHDLPDPVTRGLVPIEPDAPPTVVVATIGTRDLVPSATKASGTGVGRGIPDPGGFGTGGRGFARAWSEACNAALDAAAPSDPAAWVADHFDAPILGRLLNEAALGEDVDRLVLVVTDQAAPDPDDTVGYSGLLRLWVEGTDWDRIRNVTEIADPLVVRHSPQLIEAVIRDLAGQLAPLTEGMGRIAVERSGGMPNVGFGALLAAIAVASEEVTVRDIYIPYNRTLVEMDVGPGHALHRLSLDP